MLRVLTVSIALLLSGSTGAGNPPTKPHLLRADAPAIVQPSPEYDSEAEAELLQWANAARAQMGLAPFQSDAGLVNAARAHTEIMADHQQLSHQFPAEPALLLRVAASTSLHLDSAGENVAYAGAPDRVQDLFMHSAAHRANLLSPGFNFAGIGVIRSGDTLYVTEDFGHSLPVYSKDQAGELISAAVLRGRSQYNMPELSRHDSADLQQTACSMAQANALTGPPSNARAVLRYTAARPDNLPAAATQVFRDRSLRSFSVGSCYARSPSYVNGAYWVVLYFY